MQYAHERRSTVAGRSLNLSPPPCAVQKSAGEGQRVNS
uniref:Uncharacterized protein n=1 Tax=Anguilla anguilla TaxID=7936 RepID=A0A0E9Q1H5_ANGAN